MFWMLKSDQQFFLSPCSRNVSWLMAHDVTNISRTLLNKRLTLQSLATAKQFGCSPILKIDTVFVFIMTNISLTMTKKKAQKKLIIFLWT